MKQLILSAVFFLFSFCVMAQDSPKTRLSIVLSPQISWLDSDHDKVTPGGNVLGYDFGVVVDHFFEKNYAFSTGLTINSTGGKLKYKDGVDMEIGGVIKSGETDATYDLKYLEIPLGLKLLTNEFYRSKFYAQMGLFTQFNIQARDANGKTLSQEVNFFDMGYNIGGGVEYSIGGSTYLTMGLLYNNGFLDITHNRTIDDKATLSRLAIQLGIIF